jgi:glutamyl-tRNA synthetase
MPESPLTQKILPVRVRFAPSPTGYLHVGGARTALFNWLFARKMNGVFVLRIEDTDAERSTSESTQGILDAMRWLGLDWDEGPEVGGNFGPYQQSLRNVLYHAEADRLVREGLAYHCFCTRGDLAAMRDVTTPEGEKLHMYDGRCGRLDPAEAVRSVDAGAPNVIRLRMPRGGPLAWRDLARGELSFEPTLLDDFVLVKSDGNPTYNFAAVVDDAKMRISHIIRGDDHISNTPRQLALYDALRFPRPEIGHLPMIVGADKQRLSKRHGATSVLEFAERGILSDAMVNYLALLGWSYDGKREVFTRAELVSAFELDHVSKTAAVFDTRKLDWMNHEHFVRLGFGAQVQALLPQMRKHGMWPPQFRVELTPGPHLRVVTGHADDKIAASITPVSEEEWLREEPTLSEELPRLRLIMAALGNRLGGPHDVDVMRYFYTDDIAFDGAAVAKHLSGAAAPAWLRGLAERVEALRPYNTETLEAGVRSQAAELGVKAGELIHPARVALTGQGVSPGIFDVMYLLGRPKTVERLRHGADIAERQREFDAGSRGT